jgi:hypothetical protein
VEIPEAAADGQLIGRMIQHRGSVFYDVETRPLEQLRLTVETPYLVAVVKGTQFNVSVVNEATTISLFEGTLEIRTPDGLQSIQLNAGEIAIRSLIDDSIRRLPMDADRFDEIAQADGRQAAEADRPADARATGETSADVAVVDGAVDGTRTAVTTEVSVATEIETSGGTDGTVAKTALQADIRQISSLEVTEYRETTLVETVDLSLDSGIYTNVDLGDIEIDTVLDTTVDLGDTVLDTSLDLSIGDAGTSGGTGSSGGTVVTDDGGLTRLLSPLL